MFTCCCGTPSPEVLSRRFAVDSSLMGAMMMVGISSFALSQTFGVMISLLMGTGSGIPLGVPPAEPDPIMAKIAPQECLYYSTWAGMAEPDAASGNHTEQLLAEPEIVAFIAEVDRAITEGTRLAGQQMGGGEEAIIMKHAPLIAKTLISHPVTIFVEKVTPAAAGVSISGGLVVNGGDEADEVYDAVLEFLATAPPTIAKKVTIQGIECTQLRPDPAAPVFTFGRRDRYLIIAVGEGSFEGVLMRAATPPPAWLTEGIDTWKVPRVSTFSYANVAAISQLAAQFGGPEVARALDTLGMTKMTRAISISGLDETGFVSRTKLITSEPDKGLGAFVSRKPLQPGDLAGIPGDASIAAAIRFNAAESLGELLELTDEIEPRAAAGIQQMLSQIEQAMGLDVRDKVLPALGDVWAIHTAPESGGLLAGWTLTVSLADVKQANAAHDKLLKFFNMIAQQGFGRAPKIRTFNYGDQVAYTFDIPDNDVFVAPSWCLTETHLVVTLLPQTLKSYLAAVEAGQESIAQRPAVAELLAAEEGPCAIVYQDVRRQFVTFYPMVQYGAQFLAHQLAREGIDVDTTALPSIDAVAPHLLPAVVAARKTDDGFESYVHTTLPGANMGASAPVMVALLLPAVQSAREAARRTQSMNNLKQIALAMHNFHDVHRAFPAAYNADQAGKPLLSWRVHILPYLDQNALYEQFHLDEPWNSPHNRALIAKMPMVYRSPNSTADPGKTVYLGNAGKSGIFIAPEKKGDPQQSAASGVSFGKITDGTSNTIMAVEADDLAAVIWTKPDDWEWDDKNPLAGLGGMRPNGFLVAMCDGSVRFVSRMVDRTMLKALFTKSGGEAVRNF